MNASQLFLFDTLTQKKRLFKAQLYPKVFIYGCGPTVYDWIHIGNARAFLIQDLLVRYLLFQGYQVHFARNYTDIDDKIIQKAKKTQMSFFQVAQKFIQAFDEDMEKLQTIVPQYRPQVTKNIPAIITMIEQLLQKKLAYLVPTTHGPDIYYQLSQFPLYGKLSKRIQTHTQSRIHSNLLKKNESDFALWKAAQTGEPSWPSPWGIGRPGWHIECSAMIDHLFPHRLDIHMGGCDLIFPHHENEIAQSEGISSQPLAQYWIHNEMVTVQQEKMSKSLGNFWTLRNFLENFTADTLRLLVFQTHYRSPLDFSKENLLKSESFIEKLYHLKMKYPTPPTQLTLESDPVLAALNEDLNTPKAIGLIMKKAQIIPSLWKEFFLLFNQIFGILNQSPLLALQEIKQKRIQRSRLTPHQCEQIEAMIKKRQMLRDEKKFVLADQIRQNLKAQGILIMDTPFGVNWDVQKELWFFPSS